MSKAPITGGCMCGAIRYEVSGGPIPLSTTVCNCKDCQRTSGSSHSIVVPVSSAKFKVTQGEMKVYDTTGTDSNENRERKFCGSCGSPLVSVLAEVPELTWIKAGTLDDTSKLKPALEVWTGSSQAWMKRLPKRPHIKRGPPGFSLKAGRPLFKLLNR